MVLHSFRRWLVFVVFLFFFVIDVRAMEKDATTEQKQVFLKKNIVKKGYDVTAFVAFLHSKNGEKGSVIENWTMKELQGVVDNFQKENQPVKPNIEIQQEENNDEVSFQVNDEESGYQKPEVKSLLNDQRDEEKISSIEGNLQGDDYNNVGNEVNNYGQQSLLSSQFNIIPKGNEQLGIPGNMYDNTVDNNIQSNRSAFEFENESQDKKYFYDLSDNKIASRFFCFYRYGGKILTSLVWSVGNSYCGFEKLVMNDWYCFKYAMCLGYRLQPRFMAAWGWIDMNINFLEGIAGFLIRFFIFARSCYTIYENIFDFFNICIDIKVYNNLYFAVNIVGIVRSFVLLYILRFFAELSHFPKVKIEEK